MVNFELRTFSARSWDETSFEARPLLMEPSRPSLLTLRESTLLLLLLWWGGGGTLVSILDYSRTLLNDKAALH